MTRINIPDGEDVYNGVVVGNKVVVVIVKIVEVVESDDVAEVTG